MPDWALHVQPDTLDRRVLDQTVIWVTGQAVILRLVDMTTAHLRGVAGMLSERADELHFSAVVDCLWAVILADLAGEASGERLAHGLTGHSTADLTSTQWLETTALMRALRRELASRERP